MIVLALILGGGTEQGLWTDRILEIALLPALFLGLSRIDESRWSIAAKVLVLAVLVLFAVQFIPIGRPWPNSTEAVANGLFLTAAADRTLESLLFFVPVLGFALFLSQFPSPEQERLLRFVVVGLLINLGIGAFQLSASDGGSTDTLLPYALRAGVFANENHFSTLVVAAIPLLAYFFLHRTDRPAIFAGLVGLLLVYLFAIGSRAGMAMSLIITGIVVVMFSRLLSGRVIRATVVAALVIVGAGFALIQPDLLAIAGDMRGAIFTSTLEAIRDHWVIGTGIGSFVNVYPIYEDPTHLLNTYINHAHNDYLELLLEAGFFSLILVLAFLLLVAHRARSSTMSMAFSLSIAAIAVHSMVDYPLRTMAISILMAYLAANVLSVSARGALSSARSKA